MLPVTDTTIFCAPPTFTSAGSCPGPISGSTFWISPPGFTGQPGKKRAVGLHGVDAAGGARRGEQAAEAHVAAAGVGAPP